MKLCKGACGREPFDDFHKNKAAADGHHRECKVCAKASSKRRHHTNPEAQRIRVGPDNDEHVLWACRAPLLASVVAAWGSNKFAGKRATRVRVLIHGATGRSLQCFRQGAVGQPWHPLYLPYSSALIPLETR